MLATLTYHAKHTPLPGQGADELLEEQRDETRDDDKPGKIRCPRCRYRPRKEDRWSCAEPCFHSWNTFDTRGRCPKCQRQWTFTACPSCTEWSLHEDWYEKQER